MTAEFGSKTTAPIVFSASLEYKRGMSGEGMEFQVGDSVMIVDKNHEGELGTVIAIDDDGKRYLVVFENGSKMVFDAQSLSPRS